MGALGARRVRAHPPLALPLAPARQNKAGAAPGTRPRGLRPRRRSFRRLRGARGGSHGRGSGTGGGESREQPGAPASRPHRPRSWSSRHLPAPSACRAGRRRRSRGGTRSEGSGHAQWANGGGPTCGIRGIRGQGKRRPGPWAASRAQRQRQATGTRSGWCWRRPACKRARSDRARGRSGARCLMSIKRKAGRKEERGNARVVRRGHLGACGGNFDRSLAGVVGAGAGAPRGRQPPPGHAQDGIAKKTWWRRRGTRNSCGWAFGSLASNRGRAGSAGTAAGVGCEAEGVGAGVSRAAGLTVLRQGSARRHQPRRAPRCQLRAQRGRWPVATRSRAVRRLESHRHRGRQRGRVAPP